MTRKTFEVDNQLIQTGPRIFGPNYKGEGGLQLWLPGIKPPFGPFDYWATIGLYSLLDPKNPAAIAVIKPTELIRVLQFTQVVAETSSGHRNLTYPTQDYRLIQESLNRLYTVEVRMEGPWKVKLPGQRGAPTKQPVKFSGRILQEYFYVYPDDVTSPATLSRHERGRRVNVNTAMTAPGDAGREVWKLKGVEPVGVAYQFSSRLVNGLTGEDPNIKKTILPFKIFNLRIDFQQSPAATNLLFWVCRQTAPSMTRQLKGLAVELNQDPRRPGCTYEAIERGFDLLLKAGVIDSFEVTGDAATFKKNKDWPFKAPDQADAPPQLAAPKKAKA